MHLNELDLVSLTFLIVLSGKSYNPLLHKEETEVQGSEKTLARG